MAILIRKNSSVGELRKKRLMWKFQSFRLYLPLHSMTLLSLYFPYSLHSLRVVGVWIKLITKSINHSLTQMEVYSRIDSFRSLDFRHSTIDLLPPSSFRLLCQFSSLIQLETDHKQPKWISLELFELLEPLVQKISFVDRSHLIACLERFSPSKQFHGNKSKLLINHQILLDTCNSSESSSGKTIVALTLGKILANRNLIWYIIIVLRG